MSQQLCLFGIKPKCHFHKHCLLELYWALQRGCVYVLVKPSHLGLQPERRCNGTDLQNWTESGFTFVDRKGPAVLSH